MIGALFPFRDTWAADAADIGVAHAGPRSWAWSILELTGYRPCAKGTADIVTGEWPDHWGEAVLEALALRVEGGFRKAGYSLPAGGQIGCLLADHLGGRLSPEFEGIEDGLRGRSRTEALSRCPCTRDELSRCVDFDRPANPAGFEGLVTTWTLPRGEKFGGGGGGGG